MEMFRIIFRCLLLAVAVILGGCAEPARPTTEAESPLYVPFAVGTGQRPAQYAAGNPAHLMPIPGEEFLEIGRYDRGYYGSIMLDSISAYTEYTSDAQRIGLPNEASYRYHYSYKSGVSVP
jgi:hypothetical protein